MPTTVVNRLLFFRYIRGQWEQAPSLIRRPAIHLPFTAHNSYSAFTVSSSIPCYGLQRMLYTHICTYAVVGLTFAHLGLAAPVAVALNKYATNNTSVRLGVG